MNKQIKRILMFSSLCIIPVAAYAQFSVSPPASDTAQKTAPQQVQAPVTGSVAPAGVQAPVPPAAQAPVTQAPVIQAPVAPTMATPDTTAVPATPVTSSAPIPVTAHPTVPAAQQDPLVTNDQSAVTGITTDAPSENAPPKDVPVSLEAQFKDKFSFPLTQDKMIAYVLATKSVREINEKWDVQIAGADTDQTAIEYNNFSVEEIMTILENIPDMKLDQYNEMTRMASTDAEFGRVYRAYQELIEQDQIAIPASLEKIAKGRGNKAATQPAPVTPAAAPQAPVPQTPVAAPVTTPAASTPQTGAVQAPQPPLPPAAAPVAP